MAVNNILSIKALSKRQVRSQVLCSRILGTASWVSRGVPRWVPAAGPVGSQVGGLSSSRGVGTQTSRWSIAGPAGCLSGARRRGRLAHLVRIEVPARLTAALIPPHVLTEVLLTYHPAVHRPLISQALESQSSCETKHRELNTCRETRCLE